MNLPGFATSAGTEKYKSRFPELAEAHFRLKQNLWFSSIGIGSYLGESDDAVDALYEKAVAEAVLTGINVLDSAINYRSQRSERAFGRAVAALVREGSVTREELIICTKGGFIPFDGDFPKDPMGFFHKNYIEPGILTPDDIAQSCHAMSPKFLEDQLSKSLQNLQIETVDIYYLHNPETQLSDFSRTEFLNRLRAAFQWCEEKVKKGKICFYGLATWNGFRLEPESPDYLSLEEINVIAREVGGAEHHFKAVQLPFNLGMPEAWVLANQSCGANLVPFLNIAARNQMITVGSASLLQGRLAGPLPEFLHKHFPGLEKNSQRALQFARSAPGMTVSLVGMKNKSHTAENLQTAKVRPLTEQELLLVFQDETR